MNPEEIPIKESPIKESEIPAPDETVRHRDGTVHVYNPSDCDACMQITVTVLEGQ